MRIGSQNLELRTNRTERKLEGSKVRQIFSHASDYVGLVQTMVTYIDNLGICWKASGMQSVLS